MKLGMSGINFYKVDLDYIRTLHDEDTEVYCDSRDPNYGRKPHLGILATISGIEYLIPLTSPKPKHAGWRYKSGETF